MKKVFALVLVLMLVLCCTAAAEGAVRVASLKGPTSMGLVKLMNDNENGTAAQDYEFTLSGTADEIVPLLTRGELDIALIPCNLASILYNNTHKISILNINTLGVLYVVENGNEINTVEDLKGKTVYSTGKGTTPEFALNFILNGNGIDPETDLTVEYKSEAAEVLSALLSDNAAVAVLPQPYVTAALAQNEGLRIALSLTEEWEKADPDSALITGVTVVNNDFLAANPEAVKTFMEEQAASAAYVNEHNDEAAEWIAALGIVAKAPLAQKALPFCNIVCIEGDEMKSKICGYLNALYDMNPASVGGALPADDIFASAE